MNPKKVNLFQYNTKTELNNIFCKFVLKKFCMDIRTTKLELLKTILENENAEFIQKVSDFVKKEKSDFWNELSAAEQKEIRKGIEELDNGKRVSYEDFLKKIS